MSLDDISVKLHRNTINLEREIKQNLDKIYNMMKGFSLVEDASSALPQLKRLLNENAREVYEIRALSLIYKDLEDLESIKMKAGIEYHINRLKTLYTDLSIRDIALFFNRYNSKQYTDTITCVYELYSYVLIFNRYNNLLKENTEVPIQPYKVKVDIDNELQTKMNSLNVYKSRDSMIKENYLGFTDTFSPKYITSLNGQIDPIMRLGLQLEVNTRLKLLVQPSGINKELWNNLLNETNKDIECIVSNMHLCIDIMGYYKLLCNYYKDISLLRGMKILKTIIKKEG